MFTLPSGQDYRPWRAGAKLMTFTRPSIMAILNITPDSFSDGGRFSSAGTTGFDPDLDAIASAAREALKDGAEILDVGGMSTRPGGDPIDEAEELRRVVPAVRRIVEETGALVSVDTFRPNVAAAALEAGAEAINDITAGRYVTSEERIADADETGFPEEMAAVVREHNAGVVLMHMGGNPWRSASEEPEYPLGVVEEVCRFLARRRDAFVAAGVDPERIMLDPGLGFGKTMKENWELVAGIETLQELGAPLLYAFSRKRFLRAEAESRGVTATTATLDALTAQLCGLLAARGVESLRVHDVKTTVIALAVAEKSVGVGL